MNQSSTNSTQLLAEIDNDNSDKIDTRITTNDFREFGGKTVVVTWHSEGNNHFWVSVGKQNRHSELAELQELLDK